MSAFSTILSHDIQRTERVDLLGAHLEERWYAAYTSANHERRVAEHFGARSIGHFLPLYRSVRTWKDRRVDLELPLFPGYVFVHVPLRDRLKVVQVPGVVRLVGFNGTPAALPENEIEALKKGLHHGVHAEPQRYLTVGQRVRITSGSLAGLEGILLRRKGNWRVVLSLDLIQRSVSLEVDVCSLELATGYRIHRCRPGR